MCIQQFLGSSEPSKQSGEPSHCHDAGIQSKDSNLVLHWISDGLHLIAKNKNSYIIYVNYTHNLNFHTFQTLKTR